MQYDDQSVEVMYLQTILHKPSLQLETCTKILIPSLYL